MVDQVKKVSSKWPEILSVMSGASSVFLFIFVFGVWKGEVDSHIQNEDVHMTTGQQALTYVPRKELEKDVADIAELKRDVRDLSDKVDTKFEKLYDLITDNSNANAALAAQKRNP